MNKYNGPFKTHIQNFVEVKQALGYKYLVEASKILRDRKIACGSFMFKAV